MDTLEFWQGEFGDEYTKRCRGEDLVRNNTALFRKALAPLFFTTPQRIIEFGANIGLNIQAMRQINALSLCDYSAVEANASAAAELRKLPGVAVHEGSMLDPAEPWGGGYDLAISKGVLIHIFPEELYRAYAALYRASRRFIFLAEYHNPTPVEVPYRGHAGRLWKRDFAADMLAMFPDLQVINYGFAWKHDPYAPQDNLVWTLFERGQK